VMDTDPSTNDATNLTNTPDTNEYQPSWAPSGTQLVFVRNVPGQSISEQSDIFVMDASGENVTNLTQSDESELAPDWSPDGTKIAFSGVRDRGYEIVTMDPNGQNETILTGDSFNGDDHAPDWSPDSTKVVFMKQDMVGGCCEPWEIWAVNRDGSGDTNLTNHPRDDTFPSWSPDGTEITFSSNRNADASGQSDIYAMPAPTTLAPPSETASVPTEQSEGLIEFAASDVLMREASAQTTSQTMVRRLTRDGSSTAPDWAKNSAPTITKMRPAKESTIIELRPIIGAKVTDAQTDLVKSNIKRLFVEGTKIPRDRFTYNRDTDRLKYVPESNLSLGSHTAKVVVQDPEGLITRKLWTFSVAAQP
jgi:Tol biopolymer transport system component